MNIVGLLQLNPALRKCDPRLLAEVGDVSSVRSYAPEAPVLMAGGMQTHVLLLAKGRLALYRKNREAKTQILVSVLDPPSLLGDAELNAARSHWSVSARAIAANETVIVAIPNSGFQRLLLLGPKQIALDLYRDACARYYLALQVLQIFGLQKTRNKILRLLMTQLAAAPPGTKASLRLSQVQLSKSLGVSRQTVIRSLKELEVEGLVRREGHNVAILVQPEEFWQQTGPYGFGASWRLCDE